MTKSRIYTALVTFERTSPETPFLPAEAEGACGYMAIAAPNDGAVVETLRAALSADALRLIDVSDITETSLHDFPDELDEHLAENVRNWDANRRTVWGTIHVYLAEGEA